MAITRTAWTDDDGTGITGTVLNNAAKTSLYDQIDGAFSVFVGNDTVALADGATPALNAALGTIFRLAAGGNRTIAVPTNPTAGQMIVIEHYASGAARTLALNTGAGGFRFGSTIAALSQTESGKTDYITAVYNNTDSTWDVIMFTKGF